MDKKTARRRRATRTRMRIRALGVHRLCINRSPRHIYAQVISPAGDSIVASASTLDKYHDVARLDPPGNAVFPLNSLCFQQALDDFRHRLSQFDRCGVIHRAIHRIVPCRLFDVVGRRYQWQQVNAAGFLVIKRMVPDR